MNNSNSMELSEQNSSRSSDRSITTSPVIVLTNADYKRPSSILSSRSAEGSTTIKPAEMNLAMNWWGISMLACHFLIGMVTKINALTGYTNCFLV